MAWKIRRFPTPPPPVAQIPAQSIPLSAFVTSLTPERRAALVRLLTGG
jgi:hypothetical protein